MLMNGYSIENLQEHSFKNFFSKEKKNQFGIKTFQNIVGYTMKCVVSPTGFLFGFGVLVMWEDGWLNNITAMEDQSWDYTSLHAARALVSENNPNMGSCLCAEFYKSCT